MGASRWPGGKITSDWYESAGLMTEMQTMLGCAVTIGIRPVGVPEHPDLELTCTAVPMGQDGAEAAHSVSVKCRASSLHLATWKGLITFLLYQLDFESDRPEDAEKPAAA